MQRVIAVIARFVHWAMRVSGSEALSNVASAFVGQVEAQIMIRPYLSGMTNVRTACFNDRKYGLYCRRSNGSLYFNGCSCFLSSGCKPYGSTGSTCHLAKIVFPETEESETKGVVKLEVKKEHSNIMDAISHGASDGMKISINVIAMLIGVIALIALIDALLGYFGHFLSWTGLSLNAIGSECG